MSEFHLVESSVEGVLQNPTNITGLCRGSQLLSTTCWGGPTDKDNTIYAIEHRETSSLLTSIQVTGRHPTIIILLKEMTLNDTLLSSRHNRNGHTYELTETVSPH